MKKLIRLHQACVEAINSLPCDTQDWMDGITPTKEPMATLGEQIADLRDLIHTHLHNMALAAAMDAPVIEADPLAWLDDGDEPPTELCRAYRGHVSQASATMINQYLAEEA